MLLKVEVRLVPTSCIAAIAATAISAAIRPYSIAVAPSSFFHNMIRVANIQVLRGLLMLPTIHTKAYQNLKVSNSHDTSEHSIAYDAGGIVEIFGASAINI